MVGVRSFLSSPAFSEEFHPSKLDKWRPQTLTDADLAPIGRVDAHGVEARVPTHPTLFGRDWTWENRTPAPTSLTQQEVEVILRWASKVQGPRVFRPGHVESLLRTLLAEPINLETARGKEARQAMKELGLLTPYADEVMTVLHRDFGSHHFDDTAVHFKSHMTRGMLPLSMLLSALGAQETTATRSHKAGQPHVQSLIDFMLRRSCDDPELRRVGPAPSTKMRDWMMSRAVEALDGGHRIIIDKGSTLLSPENVAFLAEAVRDGHVRFLVHNRSDQRKLTKAFPEGFWGVDFGTSKIKDETEGRFLGLQYALWGAKVVREYWNTAPCDTDLQVQVVGYGQLGAQVVRGMRALGMPADAITVIDISEARQEAALAEGLNVRSLDGRSDRPEKALTFVAVEGEGAQLSDAEFRQLGVEQINLQVGSSNTGLDGVLSRSKANPIKDRAVVFREQGTEDPVFFRDVYVHQEVDEEETHAIFIGQNKPINLLEGGWRDPTEAVSAGVCSAFAEAQELKSPGITPMDWGRQEEVATLFHAHGLGRPRPLTNVPDDDPACLQHDLDFGYQRVLD